MAKRNFDLGFVFNSKKQIKTGVLRAIDSKEKVRDLLSYFLWKATEDLEKSNPQDTYFLPPIIVDDVKGVYRFPYHYFGACFAEWLTDGMDTEENNNLPNYWHDIIFQTFVKSKKIDHKNPAWLVFNLNALYGLFYVGFNSVGFTYYVRTIVRNNHDIDIEICANHITQAVLFDDFGLGFECKKYEIVYGEKVRFSDIAMVAFGAKMCDDFWQKSGKKPYVLW